MKTEEQKELSELITNCKLELLNHTLQNEIVSPYIKKINSYLDKCAEVLQRDSESVSTRIITRRNTKIDGVSREYILFFAYCMSKWDTEFVCSVTNRVLNQTEAFEYLAEKLNVKEATLRNYRDTFDSHVKQMRSNRQGWKKELNDEFRLILNKYNEKNENDLILLGKGILNI